jgi:hypothetical protein
MIAANQADASSARAFRLAMVAVACSAALFLGLVANSLEDETFGIDFGVFHAGGHLIADSGYEAAYDTAVFSPYFADQYFPATRERASNTHFISTPTFGWAAQALASVPFDLARALWLLTGAMVLVPAARLLDLPRWSPLVLLLSPAMAMNSALGQTGPFVLLLFVLVHRAMRSGHLGRAGAIAGLMVLKPPLAIGYGVLWLYRAKRYGTALVAAATTGVLLSVPTFVDGLAPWRTFIEVMADRADTEGAWSQQSQSLAEFLKLAMPGAGSSLTITFWVLGLGAGFVCIVLADRRWAGDNEMLSAAAVVATVVASPHLLIYDTFVLAVPVAVAYHRGVLDPQRSALLAAIVASTIAFGAVIYDAQFDLIGRGIGLEFPGLVLCIILLVRWERGGPVGSTPPVLQMAGVS